MGRRNREPMVVAASRTAVRSAIDALPDKLTWQDMAERIRPMFVRRRPLPPGAERPLTFRVAPGVTVALGVDIGPAFLYVSAGMISEWPVTGDEALAQAMANLRATVRA